MRKYLRNRTRRKVKVRIATRVTTHYIKRKNKAPHCEICHTKLQGIPSLIKSKFTNLTHSQRTVSRKYGGKLCSTCSRKVIMEEARALKL